jgi:hypothetical protein
MQPRTLEHRARVTDHLIGAEQQRLRNTHRERWLLSWVRR